MGAHPWIYFVPYIDDVNSALLRLRESEFLAGRFRGSEDAPKSIDEALFASCQCGGTASILDMYEVSEELGPGRVTPLGREELLRIYGTEQPTRELVKTGHGLYQILERGHGLCFVVYRDGRPDELCMAGYSFD